MKDFQKLLNYKTYDDLFDGVEPNGEVVDLRDVAFLLADKPRYRKSIVQWKIVSLIC
jgi:hypothetical protein